MQRQHFVGTVAGVLLWAAGAIVATGWHVDSMIERERARFSTDFDRAFVAVNQRLDQNEALLDGLVALLRSSRDGEFPELRPYANEMLKRYAHLYTIGYQPRVSLAQRTGFEQRMSRTFARPFRIRDFSLGGDRTWRDAPERPFYFPVTFMAPELPEASSVIGYDVYEDRQFHDAIERAGRLGEPVAAPPFDLVEGGRGYTYLHALHLPARADTQERAPPDHLISLLIRADRLFAGVVATQGGRIELHHRGVANAAAARLGGVGEMATPTATPAWAVGLPAFHLQRAMQSTRQPFDLTLNARPQWSAFSWPAWSLWMAAWTALVLAAAATTLALSRQQRMRQLAQQQTALAREDLAVAERRAEASRARSLDELGSGIAHELNQPLTAVVGYSQAALRLLDSAAAAPSSDAIGQLRDTLQANAQQALRAAALMQRLRLLVRQQPMRMQPLQLQDVIARALRLEQVRIDAAGIALQVRAPQAGVAIVGDTILLEQLLSNLLRNAVDALDSVRTQQPGIEIELDAQGPQARLSVADNGPGLTPAQLERAFHPFQSNKPEGIGIGLVVCAAIARAHGGDIDARSPDSGGARFTVTLPLIPSTAAASLRHAP